MSSTVTFGMGLVSGQKTDWDDRSQAQIMADILDGCTAVEAAGVGTLWFSEHHFFDDSYLSSVFPVLGAVAARTSTLRIGTGVLTAHFYDALRLAEDSATVDQLSGGRFVLGLGHGWRAAEFDAFGVATANRGRGLERIIGELRDAWSGDRPVRGVSVTPKPFSPDGLPLWLGGKSAAQCRRAGALADGFISQSGDIASLARDAALVAEGAAAAGRDLDDFEFGAMLSIFPWDGPDGWMQIGDGVRYVYSKYKQMATRGFSPPPSSPTPRVPLGDGTPELLAADPSTLAKVVADAISVIQQTLPTARVHVIARSWWPGVTPDVLERSARAYVEQVVPEAMELLSRGLAPDPSSNV